MRLLVDTNILIYGANTDCGEHASARRFLTGLVEERIPWCLTWGIIYEFLRVSTHARILPRPMTADGALHYVNAFLDRDEVTVLTPTGRHRSVLEKTLGEISRAAGNLFHDIETAVLLREYGVPEIATADTDFLQFRFLKVVNPIQATHR